LQPHTLQLIKKAIEYLTSVELPWSRKFSHQVNFCTFCNGQLVHGFQFSLDIISFGTPHDIPQTSSDIGM
jgi:hypothetical protein